MLGIVRQRIDNSSFKGETLEETEKRFPLLKADSDFGTKATQVCLYYLYFWFDCYL
jgi:hypothetical protein